MGIKVGGGGEVIDFVEWRGCALFKKFSAELGGHHLQTFRLFRITRPRFSLLNFFLIFHSAPGARSAHRKNQFSRSRDIALFGTLLIQL